MANLILFNIVLSLTAKPSASEQSLARKARVEHTGASHRGIITVMQEDSRSLPEASNRG